MTNYTIHYYGVQFSNGHNVTNMDEVVEPISAQEYYDLVEGGDEHFAYEAYSAIRKRIENHFGHEVKHVTGWDTITEHV